MAPGRPRQRPCGCDWGQGGALLQSCGCSRSATPSLAHQGGCQLAPSGQYSEFGATPATWHQDVHVSTPVDVTGGKGVHCCRAVAAAGVPPQVWHTKGAASWHPVGSTVRLGPPLPRAPIGATCACMWVVGACGQSNLSGTNANNVQLLVACTHHVHMGRKKHMPRVTPRAKGQMSGRQRNPNQGSWFRVSGQRKMKINNVQPPFHVHLAHAHGHGTAV